MPGSRDSGSHTVLILQNRLPESPLSIQPKQISAAPLFHLSTTPHPDPFAQLSTLYAEVSELHPRRASTTDAHSSLRRVDTTLSPVLTPSFSNLVSRPRSTAANIEPGIRDA